MFLIDLPQQKKTLLPNFFENIKKMYGWELNENSWQEEKCFVTNDWLDDTLKNIKLELGSKIVSKLIALLQVEEKDAERLSLQIISFYETIF